MSYDATTANGGQSDGAIIMIIIIMHIASMEGQAGREGEMWIRTHIATSAYFRIGLLGGWGGLGRDLEEDEFYSSSEWAVMMYRSEDRSQRRSDHLILASSCS